MKTSMFRTCLLVLLVSALCCTAKAQQTEQRLGAGIAIGSSQSLYAVYTISPNIHAGLSAGTRGIGAFGRVLLPLAASGIAPFAVLSYNFRPAMTGDREQGFLGASLGLRYSISPNAAVLAQIDPIEFGFQGEVLPSLSVSFPSARLGIEFFF
ncbi:MAG: hypothetical protein ACOVSW_16085 [Candidatus Kapaibacteriota bacterium]|jgi:hypothetical protein